MTEPTSRLAIWARRIAGFAFAATLLAIIIVRSGMLEIDAGARHLRRRARVRRASRSCSPSRAFVVIWREGLGGLGAALAAMLIGARAPRLSGLSRRSRPTSCRRSTTSPPIRSIRRASRRSRALRPRDANPVAYAGLYAAEQQRTAYPDIGPLGTNAHAAGGLPSGARGHHQAQMAHRRCDVAPQPPAAATARIEAVARTPIMGFRDDVVVRVAPEPDGARIDVRSASRYGRHDFGTNAARIRSAARTISTTRRAQKPSRSRPQKPLPRRRRKPQTEASKIQPPSG